MDGINIISDGWIIKQNVGFNSVTYIDQNNVRFAKEICTCGPSIYDHELHHIQFGEDSLFDSLIHGKYWNGTNVSNMANVQLCK